MKAIVASLKRLYTAGKLDKATLKARVVKGTITEDEYELICGEEYSA